MNPAPDPWWVAPAVIAAAIAGVIAVLTLVANGRRARADRQRELFGMAFGDVSSYCEYPYIVRRRRHDLAEEERIRITTELSEVQRKLNHNRATLQVEAPRVARAYAALVDATRRIAGAAIHDGWNMAPITADSNVHVNDVNLSGIKPYEDAYLTVVADHVALTPWWLRVAARWMTRQASRIKLSDRHAAPAGAAPAEELVDGPKEA